MGDPKSSPSSPRRNPDPSPDPRPERALARTRVVIVEDQPRLRDGLALILDSTAALTTVGQFASMERALAEVARLDPDVALVDLGLPGMSGIEGTRRIRETSPRTQVLVLTVHDDDRFVFEAICAGASGYLLKDTPPARLVEAIVELAAGGAPMSPAIARRVVAMFQRTAPPAADAAHLSPREVAVLKLLAQGHSYKTAARELELSLDTVRFHIRNTYDKLHVHSKSAAVMAAVRQRIIE